MTAKSGTASGAITNFFGPGRYDRKKRDSLRRDPNLLTTPQPSRAPEAVPFLLKPSRALEAVPFLLKPSRAPEAVPFLLQFLLLVYGIVRKCQEREE